MFSEDEIQSKALELANAGVKQSDIEAWIQVSRQERDALANRQVGVQEQAAPALTQSEVDMQALKQYGMAAGEMGLRGAAIAGGQAAGLRAPGITKLAAVPLGGATSAALTDIAIQKAGNQPYSLGQTLGEAAIGTLPGIGITPAGQAGARTAIQALRQAVPQALEYFMQPQGFRTLSTLYGASALKTGMEEGRAPSAGEVAGAVAATGFAGATRQMPRTAKQQEQAKRMVDDAVTNTNSREWIARGGKIDPTLTYRDSALNRGLSETAGGSIEIQRAANEVNQRVVNQLAREDMRLVDAPLDALHIQDRIIKLSAPLREIGKLGDDFSNQIDAVRNAREAAREAWNAYKSAAERGQPSTAARNEAKSLTAAAANQEDTLEKMLSKAGQKDLLEEYTSARGKLAQIYAYRDALIEGNISPQILYDQKDVQKRVMSGNADLIARVFATMPKVMRDIRDVQPVSENIPMLLRRTAGAALGATAIGTSTGMSPGLTAAGAFLGSSAPTIARKTAMSPLYQRLMAAPRYAPDDPALAMSLARFGAMSGANP